MIQTHPFSYSILFTPSYKNYKINPSYIKELVLINIIQTFSLYSKVLKTLIIELILKKNIRYNVESHDQKLCYTF